MFVSTRTKKAEERVASLGAEVEEKTQTLAVKTAYMFVSKDLLYMLRKIFYVYDAKLALVSEST
jgi:hypothetical protein